MKYIVDIKGEIKGDYEIIGKYEERPQGEWEETNETDLFSGLVYKCTQCGKETLACDCHNFCTWCGADMKGEENEV